MDLWRSIVGKKQKEKAKGKAKEKKVEKARPYRVPQEEYDESRGPEHNEVKRLKESRQKVPLRQSNQNNTPTRNTQEAPPDQIGSVWGRRLGHRLDATTSGPHSASRGPSLRPLEGTNTRMQPESRRTGRGGAPSSQDSWCDPSMLSGRIPKRVGEPGEWANLPGSKAFAASEEICKIYDNRLRGNPRYEAFISQV